MEEQEERELVTAALDSLRRQATFTQIAEVKKRLTAQQEISSQLSLFQRSLHDQARSSHLFTLLRLKQRYSLAHSSVLDLSSLRESDLTALRDAIAVPPRQSEENARESRNKEVERRLKTVRELLLWGRFQESPSDHKAEEAERTIEQGHSCVEIQPERVLAQRSEEKSTERVQHLSAKLVHLRTAIADRLAGFRGFERVEEREESFLSVSFRLAGDASGEILVQEDKSMSLFAGSRPALSPTPPPDSPNLSSVSPPSYPEDWTLSFLSAPSPHSSLLLPAQPPYHSIRVARNSGDEDQSLEPVSLSPLDLQTGQVDVAQTAIRPSKWKGWRRVLLCACWRRQEAR